MFSEPLKLYGEGSYNLNVVKDVKGTEYYFGLDENVRKCQHDEPYENCTTRAYETTLRDSCGCIPINMMTSQHSTVRIAILHCIVE